MLERRILRGEGRVPHRDQLPFKFRGGRAARCTRLSCRSAAPVHEEHVRRADELQELLRIEISRTVALASDGRSSVEIEFAAARARRFPRRATHRRPRPAAPRRPAAGPRPQRGVHCPRDDGRRPAIVSQRAAPPTKKKRTTGMGPAKRIRRGSVASLALIVVAANVAALSFPARCSGFLSTIPRMRRGRRRSGGSSWRRAGERGPRRRTTAPVHCYRTGTIRASTSGGN